MDFRGDEESVVNQKMQKIGRQWYCLFPGCKEYQGNYMKQAVQRHVYIHLGFKPFQCAYCPLRVNRKENLLVHYKMKHRTGHKYP